MRISTPGSAPSSSAKRDAWSQQRSTSAATPSRPERADRGVDREAARAPGELRRPVQLVPCRVGVGLLEVAGADGHRRAMGAGMRRRTRSRSRRARSATCGRPSPTSRPAPTPARDAGDAARRRPRGRTRRRRAARRRCPRPRPRLAATGRSARVDVAGLSADDRRADPPARAPAVAPRRRMRPCPSAATARSARCPDTEVAKGAVDGDVALLPDQDADARRALEPVALRDPSPHARARGGAPLRAPSRAPSGNRSRRRPRRRWGGGAARASHSSATSSTTAAARPITTGPRSDPRSSVSQSAASAAGSAPPMTKPKIPPVWDRDHPGLGRSDQVGESPGVLPSLVGERPAERGAASSTRPRPDRALVERADGTGSRNRP